MKGKNKALETKIKSVVEAIEAEVRRAATLHAPMHSPHEGYAVILEELDELKEEVWKKAKNRDTEKMRSEAIQTAAMAARFVVDLL